MSLVTWEDKDKNKKDGVHNKFKDTDANQLKAAVNSKIDNDRIGQANGIPQLDGAGKIPAGQLPVITAAPAPGSFIICDPWDATGGIAPTSGGTGPAGAIRKGNAFPLTGTGLIDGEEISAITWLVAKTDDPAQDFTKWKKMF